MKVIQEHDILVIGGGGAGLRAAISAALLAERENIELSVALISKVYPIRSHTVSAEGGIAGVLPRAGGSGEIDAQNDDFDSHAFDTIRAGGYLADQDAVLFFVREAPKEIIKLENWGCLWSRDKNGNIAVRKFGGMSRPRTVYAADKTGFYMLHNLFERSLKYDNIIRYDEWYVSRLLTDESKDEDKRVVGCVAISIRTGEKVAFLGKSVILATGGAGRLYRFTTNGRIKTGDGMALALRAGAALKDMEFVQFHPTGLARTGILITEAARGEGGYLLNRDGERFLERYVPKEMELAPRDLICRAIISELEAGRGVETPYGPCVHLDLRHLGEKLINEKLPFVREISVDYEGIDPVKELIPVRPALHYFMGGVHTTLRSETTLKGLYAAGETACVSIHGANRLGSNSLAECLVFGRVAGEQAAMFAIGERDFKVNHSVSDQIKEEENRLDALLRADGPEKATKLLHELNEVMELSAGIVRDEARMVAGLARLRELKKRYANLGLSDHGLIFNSEFIGALELSNMLDVAECLLTAALKREESRGCHVRDDFPKCDNENFLHHQILTRDSNEVNPELRLTTSPVTITSFEPIK